MIYLEISTQLKQKNYIYVCIKSKNRVVIRQEYVCIKNTWRSTLYGSILKALNMSGAQDNPYTFLCSGTVATSKAQPEISPTIQRLTCLCGTDEISALLQPFCGDGSFGTSWVPRANGYNSSFVPNLMSRRPRRSMEGLSFIFGQIPRLVQTESQTLTAFPVVLEKPFTITLPKPSNDPATKRSQAAASHSPHAVALASTQQSLLVHCYFVYCFKISLIAAITMRHWEETEALFAMMIRLYAKYLLSCLTCITM